MEPKYQVGETFWRAVFTHKGHPLDLDTGPCPTYEAGVLAGAEVVEDYFRHGGSGRVGYTVHQYAVVEVDEDGAITVAILDEACRLPKLRTCTMEPSNIITLAQLRAWGACRSACERFQREFGDELVVTRDYVREYCHEFNMQWLRWHSLSRTSLAQLYERVPKPVLADCTDIGAVVQKYHEDLALAWFDLWTNREEKT